MYLLTLTFVDDQLSAVKLRNQWLSPLGLIEALTSCRANTLDITGVRWRDGGVVPARAWKTDSRLRIGAGTYHALTVLTAE